MAMQKTYNLPTGLEASNAYHRVERVVLVGKDRMTFRVRSYTSVACPPFSDEGFACEYDLAGDNPIRQAYLYLRTLPQFADATDC